MTETLYISKEETFHEEEVVAVFKNSEDLEEIKKTVEQSKERLYVSWASVDAVDNQNQKIPISLIIRSQEDLMKRGAPIMYRHSNKHVGKTLAFKIMQHPQTGKLGVLHLNKIFNDLPIDHEVWENIKNGTLKGSSVGGQGIIGTKEYDSDLKSMVDVYSGFGQYETSIVKNPANPLALNEAYSEIAKEKQMEETNNFNIEDVVKGISESVEQIKTDIAELKANKVEVAKEEAVSVSEQVTPTAPAVSTEAEKAGGSSLSVDDLASQIGELKKTVETLSKSYYKKEDSKEEESEDAKKEESSIEKENVQEASVEKETTEEVAKEEVTEEKTEVVKGEKVIETQAPEVAEVKSETVNVSKEITEKLSAFDKGEASFEEVMAVARGKKNE